MAQPPNSFTGDAVMLSMCRTTVARRLGCHVRQSIREIPCPFVKPNRTGERQNNMRLINVQTLRLQSFIGHPPPYAILSHRWTSQESCFQDFQDPRKRMGPGFDKIVAFCRLVRSLEKHCDWCWVDTVCIDKTSSAEVSEAINSMWEYYSDAVYCVAYLSDVPSPAQGGDVCCSQWFERGWTLQELLAPRHVHFYDAAWRFIESKGKGSFFGLLISIASRVSTANLTAVQSIQRASVAERMSWAAERTTTKAEDGAYCLMGLFDVNMPLLYGEGGTKAFRRLQRAIIEQSDDESIFAFYGGGGGGMLADSPQDFRGSGRVCRANRVKRSPYVITHKGLRIQGPAIQTLEGPWGEAFLMKLNCVRRLERPKEPTAHDSDGPMTQGCILGVVRENDRMFRHSGLERAAQGWTSEEMERSFKEGTWRKIEAQSLLIALEEREGDVSSDNDSVVATVAIERELQLKCIDAEGPWYAGLGNGGR